MQKPLLSVLVLLVAPFAGACGQSWVGKEKPAPVTRLTPGAALEVLHNMDTPRTPAGLTNLLTQTKVGAGIYDPFDGVSLP